MKLMKKLSAVLLSLCLMMPCFSMVVSAADGRISFTDPSTAVGEFVEVKCVLRSTSGNMGDVEVELTYDEEYLRFKSGDSITDNGNGSLTCAGAATSAEVTFVAKFQALQEGSTKVGIASASIEDSNGASLTLDQGSSAVTIAAGDPSKIEEDAAEGEAPATSAEDQQIDVNGVAYTLTDEFADADIPNGYARTQRDLDGVERQMVENETGTICLGYMRDAEGVGDFFLYNEENATFSPYAEISISDMASIVVLSDSSQVSLPGNYQEAKLSLSNKEFPVWQDTENEGMYVLYAMNGNGEAGFYQYDSIEGTYQRFEPGVAEEAEEEETDASSILGKIQNFVEGHMAILVLVVGLGGIIGLLILIILAVKLHNRNAELDELYDEYGIDLEEEELLAKKESKKSKKEAKKEAKKARKQPVEDFEEEFEEFEEEDFEEFEEESFEEEFEEFEEEEFEEEEFEEFEDYREEEYVSKQQPVEEFTGYTERMDFTIDDLDDLLEEKSGKKAGHMEDDDTFKMDFIDLD